MSVTLDAKYKDGCWKKPGEKLWNIRIRGKNKKYQPKLHRLRVVKIVESPLPIGRRKVPRPKFGIHKSSWQIIEKNGYTIHFRFEKIPVHGIKEEGGKEEIISSTFHEKEWISIASKVSTDSNHIGALYTGESASGASVGRKNGVRIAHHPNKWRESNKKISEMGNKIIQVNT